MIAIGMAAAQSGVSIEAIRYYEREGVVPKARRADNGRRVYDRAAVGRLRFIRRCRDLGFSIPEAKSLLGLSEAAKSDCAAAFELGQVHLTKVQRKIGALQALEDGLKEMTVNCRTGNTSCPMLDQLRAD